MSPAARHRVSALMAGPDPWPEALAAAEAEPMTDAQREQLLRAFDDTLETPSPPPPLPEGR